MSQEQLHTIAINGALATFLTEEGTAAAELIAALPDKPVWTRRGSGYSVAITAPLDVHRELAELAWVIEEESSQAERRGLRSYRYAIRTVEKGT